MVCILCLWVWEVMCQIFSLKGGTAFWVPLRSRINTQVTGLGLSLRQYLINGHRTHSNHKILEALLEFEPALLLASAPLESDSYCLMKKTVHWNRSSWARLPSLLHLKRQSYVTACVCSYTQGVSLKVNEIPAVLRQLDNRSCSFMLP